MKRGQSALEYLTTYGFAFLGLLAVIGALSYFGLFNVASFVPARCSLDGTMDCPSFAIEELLSGDVLLEMQFENNLQEKLTITRIKIKEKKAEVYCANSTEITDLAGNSLDVGDRTIAYQRAIDTRVQFNGGSASCPSLVDSGLDGIDGTKRRYDLQVYYIKGDATKPSIATGTAIISAR